MTAYADVHDKLQQAMQDDAATAGEVQRGVGGDREVHDRDPVDAVADVDHRADRLVAIAAHGVQALHVRQARDGDPQPAVLLDNLGALTTDLEAGSVVVIEQARIRIRPLPFGG